MDSALATELSLATMGGLLIGASAVALMFLIGRIAGISGITWGAMTTWPADAWRWLFLAGLLGGTALAHEFGGVPLPQASQLPTGMAVLGGLVVGIGVRLGNGCTSGLGVCGIGLLSRRSLAGTLTFMFTAMVTVLILRHVLHAIPGVDA